MDKYCPINKSNDLIDLVLHFKAEASRALEKGVPVAEIVSSKAKYRISDVKMELEHEKLNKEVTKEITKEMEALIAQFA